MALDDVEQALQMFEFLLEAIKLEVAGINRMGGAIDSAESAKVTAGCTSLLQSLRRTTYN